MIDTSAFHDLSYGLYIVNATDPSGRKVGCIANTFQQVASKPAKASVALNKDNVTTRAILESKTYGITVLDEKATMELIGTFGFKNSDDVEKYSAVSHEMWSDGIPYVTEASCAAFEVAVTDIVDVGTHLMFIGEVREAKVLSSQPPMTYSYYHSVLRGKTPPKAVSYVDEQASSPEETVKGLKEVVSQTQQATCEGNGTSQGQRFGWRCSLCGYIIEDEAELPDDFTCPICGVGKEFFERIALDC